MKKNIFLIISIVALYFFSHVYNLTGIPVFADEAIYIRWAQLIISDSNQYLFFPLNDGKTPLFIWLLVPFLKLFFDPLFAARFLSVIVGFIQILVITYTYKLLHKNNFSFIPVLLVTVLPFWVLYHRFALMDALLTLFTTILIALCIRFNQLIDTSTIRKKNFLLNIWNAPTLLFSTTFGILFFLALFTKLPALLLLPSLGMFLVISRPIKRNTFIINFMQLALSTLIGFSLFALLSFEPSFPQLFSRGSDFLYKLEEFKSVSWWTVIKGNTFFVFNTYYQYLTLPLFLILLITPIFQKNRSSISLLCSSVLFFLPFIFLAKVFHGRYILPMLPFISLSLASSITYLHEQIQQKYNNKVLLFFYCIIFTPALLFSKTLIMNPEQAPLTHDDTSQYFKDWSSGHGVFEVYKSILEESKHRSIAVATEGTFGTLPDGILMYLFKDNVENIYVEGIGQPVFQVEGKYLDTASNYETNWLIVNNFRMNLKLEDKALLDEYCRPQMPEYCLQVWDISEIIKK